MRLTTSIAFASLLMLQGAQHPRPELRALQPDLFAATGVLVNAAADVDTTRAKYSFSPRMFVDALSRYDPSSKQLNATVRSNFLHHPLSDLFIVYNDQRFLTPGAPVAGRSIIVEFTQMLAY